jgi:hypothetical protein
LTTKQSNSNVILPTVNFDGVNETNEEKLTEPDRKEPFIQINYTERISNPTEETSVKPEVDMKSKTFYNNNIISRTKVNFEKNTQMSSTQYNTNPNKSNFGSVVNNDPVKPTFKESKFKYIKPKGLNLPKKSYKYSLDKLEPDFSFKTTQLSFDPMSGMNKKGNKFFFAPSLK